MNTPAGKRRQAEWEKARFEAWIVFLHVLSAVILGLAFHFLGIMDQTRDLLFGTPLADMIQFLKLPV